MVFAQLGPREDIDYTILTTGRIAPARWMKSASGLLPAFSRELIIFPRLFGYPGGERNQMENARIYKLKMNPEQVEKFQALLMEKSGLVFEGRRIREMERAIAKRMIELGISSFDEYHDSIKPSREGRRELSRLLISLTVGETQFFRTPDQFAALRKYVLPELIEAESKGGKELRILSAGCATGEEPYSLHIILKELIPDIDSWRISITACDINQEFLKTAKKGVYGERKLRLVDPVTSKRYFKRLSKNQWRVSKELKERIEWRHFNITSNNYGPLLSDGMFHLVLCRNVLIYFNLKTMKKVIALLYEIMLTGGYLMLGYSETLFKISDLFQSVHTPEAFFYLKTETPSKHARELPEKPAPFQREEFLEVLGSRPHPGTVNKEKTEKAEPGRLLEIMDKRDAAKAPPLEKAVAPRPFDRGEIEAKGAPGPESLAPLPENRSAPAAPRGDGITEDKLWEEAISLFAEEKFGEARELFDEMAEQNPRSARAHLGLGLLYANCGEERLCREHAEKAQEFDDLLPEVYFLLALLDEKNGELARAVENYQRVILLCPNFAMAHFNLGNLYIKLSRNRDARREFRNTKDILNREFDNSSLRFSGGLSRESVIQFCNMQSKQ
jgi:chemotaxis protein methyltransferase CheR